MVCLHDMAKVWRNKCFSFVNVCTGIAQVICSNQNFVMLASCNLLSYVQQIAYRILPIQIVCLIMYYYVYLETEQNSRTKIKKTMMGS